MPQTATYLRDCGAEVVQYHDDISQTQSENVNSIVNYHNSRMRDLDISVDFNAASRTEDPRGIEVLYLSESGRVIAEKVSAAISSSSGLSFTKSIHQ